MIRLLAWAVIHWLLVLSLFLLLSSCGADESELQQIRREYGSDPELTPYVLDFHTEMIARGLPPGDAPAQLMWRNLDADDAIGLCILPFRFVYIHPLVRAPDDPLAGDESGPLRRALVYHELAHCMYSAPHDEASDHILSEFLHGPDIAEWSADRWEYELDRLAAWISVASMDSDIRSGSHR